MIFVIRNNRSDGYQKSFRDWYEITEATSLYAEYCSFYATDVRQWFKKHVFKKARKK